MLLLEYKPLSQEAYMNWIYGDLNILEWLIWSEKHVTQEGKIV